MAVFNGKIVVCVFVFLLGTRVTLQSSLIIFRNVAGVELAVGVTSGVVLSKTCICEVGG